MTVAVDEPTLAAALNHSAFNVSNAVGANLGTLLMALSVGVQKKRQA